MVDGNWTTPTPLSQIINRVQAEGEKWPSSNENHFESIDGKNFIYCTQIAGEAGIDLYKTILTTEGFSKPEKLTSAVNLEDKWEYAPVLSPDGKYLFFQTYNREDGIGGDDIYVSRKNIKGEWEEAKNLGSLINTKGNECPATITSDGKYFFFTSDRSENPDEYLDSSIYYIEFEALELDKLFL